MKTLLLLLISFASFGQGDVLTSPGSGAPAWSFVNTTPGQQIARAKSLTVPRGYLEYLPSGYSTSSELYPCIIFLHGSGERGDGSATALQKVDDHGTPKFIKNGATMCFTIDGKEECFIVLSPQQVTSRSGWTNDVVPFVQWALTKYRIDPNRVYVTGLSMGGDGTWQASYSTGNEPNFFAAIAPVSCKGDYYGAQETAKKKIPVWAFHGDADNAVPVSSGRRPINGMIAVKANPAPIFTLIPGGTHSGSTWDKVYSPTNTYYKPNMYEWFLSYGTPTIPPPPPVVELDTVVFTFFKPGVDSVFFKSKSGQVKQVSTKISGLSTTN